MQRSSLNAHRPARLVLLFFVALCILFTVSSSKPWAAGKLTPDEAGSKSTTANLKNNLPLNSPAAVTGKYTLNQYVYPGSATFSSLSPALVTTSPQITSWSIGVPILYVITIGNSDPTQTTPVDITLKDDLASSLGSNFVVLNVKCDAATANGAVCPAPTTLPQANAPLSFTIPNIKIKVGGSNDIVIRVLGYYTGPNSYQNTFSVFETGKQSTTEEVGPSKNVQITNNWSAIDLKLTKTASTTSTSLSAATAATIHYTLTLTGDSAQDFYPGNALRIADTLIASYPPVPSYSISNFTCTSVGSTCPAPPSPLTPGASASGSNTNAYTYLIWPAGSSTVIKKGEVITLKFDLEVKLASDCGSSSISIQNQAAITMSSFTYGDANNPNNTATTPANSFTTGLTKTCESPPPAAATITKKRVCPTSDCPVVNWGDTVTYQIDVKNNLSTAQGFFVKDYVSKQSITVPLKATLSPNSVPADVHCSPATIVCTTTPATTVPPQNVLQDALSYELFQTDFTLQPKGSPGDAVALTFNVRIDKLADCETDTGNFFDNVANLFQSSFAFVGGTPEVTVKLPDLSPCEMKVTKTLDQPTNGITFGQPVSYTITYENLNNKPITVRTLRDALNMRDLVNSSTYGNIPITNLSANCTTTTGVSPLPIYQLTHTQISSSYPDWQGSLVIQEPSGGMTFPANSKLQCTVSFVPHEPSATDNYCKGSGKPEIVNSAFMDVSAFYDYGVKPSSPFFAQVTAPLPLCRKVSVLKSVANGVSSTGPNGLLTFQIDITNYGNHAVNNFQLTDPLPLGFSDNGPVTCNPITACSATPTFSGTSPRVLNAVFNAIPGTSASPNNTVTLTFKVNAPLAGGTYPNTATGSFGPGPAGANFYFEGDPAVLLVNSAQVQVLTPTLIKSFAPGGIALNGNAVLTFTITNQTSDPAQTGIAFTDLLPSGVTITSAPATACGGTVSVSGGNSVSLANGTLAQGQHQCQFSVNLKGTSCGKFVNDKSNFSKVTNLDVTNAQATLEVTGCIDDVTPTPTPTPSCGVKTDEISCNTDGSRGYSYKFTVTNNTGRVVTALLLTPKTNSGISIDPQQPKLPTGGIAIGASFTSTATITGGKPNQPACFTVTLMTQDGECCTTEVCPVLPDCCGIAKDQSIECNGDGTYTYVVSIVNTGSNTIEHIYLNPQAGSTMSQTYFAVSLKPGDTFTAKVIIKGAKPGKYCFGISLHTAGMKDCCSGERCLILPECPIKNSR